MSFSIFSLPSLALFEVLNNLGPLERLILSLCSQKATNFIKKNTKKLKGNRLEVSSNAMAMCNPDSIDICFIVNFEPLSTKVGKEIAGIQGTQVLCFIEERSMFTCLSLYFEDQVQGAKSIVIHVLDLFRMDVESLVIKGDNDIWMMDWLQNCGKSIDLIYMGSEKPTSDENLRKVLRGFNSNRLIIDTKPSDMFRMPNYRKKVDQFTLQQGKWISLENLKALDSIEIRIFKKKFSNSEINLFLRHWISGGNSRLRYFQLPVRNGKIELILEGIESMKLEDGWSVRKQVNLSSDYTVIQRFDGMMATIDCFGGDDVFLNAILDV